MFFIIINGLLLFFRQYILLKGVRSMFSARVSWLVEGVFYYDSCITAFFTL